jgi:hypothetical protein
VKKEKNENERKKWKKRNEEKECLQKCVRLCSYMSGE